MSTEQKKSNACFVPMFNGKIPVPPMPFMPKAEGFEWPEAEKVEKDIKKMMDEFDANMMSFWNQMIGLQKSSIKSSKAQMEQFYADVMKIQDNLTSSLPEEFPALPGVPAPLVTPKEAMKQVKKFQEMSKKCVEEQVDSYTDFCIKSQEQTLDVTNKVVDKASDIRNGEAEEKAAPAKKPAKKQPAKKPAKKPAKEKAEPAPAEEENPVF